MSATLILPSQFVTNSNVLVLPQLLVSQFPVTPDDLPPFNAGTQHDGIQWIDWDVESCLDCYYLYRDPALQYFWFTFYSDACAASSSDTYLPGVPALVWARHLINGLSDPYWSTIGPSAPLPLACSPGGITLTPSQAGYLPTGAGCFPPPQADLWIQTCGVVALGDTTLTGTDNILFQYGTIKGPVDPPVGEAGIVPGPAAWLALDPTRRGAPTPFHISGCGCNGSPESEEEEINDVATIMVRTPVPSSRAALLRSSRSIGSPAMPRPVSRVKPASVAGSDFSRQPNNPASPRR